MPKFVEGATRMQNKKEVKSLTDNSRGSLWMARVEEFTTSPLWGIGFSATGIGAEKQVGLPKQAQDGFLFCRKLDC